MSFQANSFIMKKLQFITLIFLILLSSCVATSHKIVKEERNPAWQGSKIDNILVVGAYEDRAFRISAESVFADQLKSKGLSAMTTAYYESNSQFHVPNLGQMEYEVLITFKDLLI